RNRAHRFAVAGRKAGRHSFHQTLGRIGSFTMIEPSSETRGISVSFEFFPPKPGDAEIPFWQTIAKLERVGPKFVSVTYGAGGTTRDRTLGTLKRLAAETKLKPAGHLTCVGATKEEVNEVIRDY